MIFDSRKEEWRPYKPPSKDRKRLKEVYEELVVWHEQREKSRAKYQQAIPSEPMEIGDEVFVKEVSEISTREMK